jgi:hypothetical protein
MYSEIRAWLTELRCGVLYVLRPRLCALEDLMESLVILEFSIVKGAKMPVKELKSLIGHKLDN